MLTYLVNVHCAATVRPMWWPETSVSHIPVWSSSDQGRRSVEWGWTVFLFLSALQTVPVWRGDVHVVVLDGLRNSGKKSWSLILFCYVAEQLWPAVRRKSKICLFLSRNVAILGFFHLHFSFGKDKFCCNNRHQWIVSSTEL